jgi:hypothetical protein
MTAKRDVGRFLAFCLILVGLALVFSSLYRALPALAASVAHISGVVGNGSPASCTDAALATAVAGGGTISFNCGPAPHTILVSTSVITQTTTVDGGGKITLDGENLRQIFYVYDGGNLTVRNITLFAADGFAGGAIYNEDIVTLQLVTVENSSTSGNGGAIFNNGGVVTISDSTFINNSGVHGGAIYNDGGTVSVARSLLMGNVAQTHGGGIYNASGQVSVTNSTFAGNFADTGGGLYNDVSAQAVLLNVTMNINRADIGGAIFNNFSNISAKNSIMANSLTRNGLDPSLNCDGPSIISEGYNIIGDGSCVPADVEGDQRNTDPELGPLQDNGGPTLTHMPLSGSPAINNGTNVGCPATDQRGASRPVGAACDIGAAEYGGLLPYLYLPLVVR